MEAWGFVWLMLVMKIPIAALLWLVWWAVRSQPEPDAEDGGDDDGGIGREDPHPRLPRGPRRRGPHGDPVPPAPARTRVTGRDRVPPRGTTSRDRPSR